MIKNKVPRESWEQVETFLDMHNILDSITDGFLAVDFKWNVIKINIAAEDILNNNRLKGESIWNEFPKNSVVEKNLTQCMEQHHTVHFESFSAISKRWLEFSAYPSNTGIYVYFRDITERKNVEKILRTERERLYAVLDGLPGIVYMQASDYTMPFANRQFRETLGDPEGKTCYELTKGVCKPCAECTTEKLLRQGAPQRSVSQRIYSGRLYELHEQALEDFQGKRFVVKILVDITEKVKAEQEIARLDRLNLVGEMAATIAHEVRNPMTTVRGFLQMLESKTELEPYKEYFQLMVNELDRANFIITDFLSLARNKKQSYKVQDLNNIIDSLYPLLSVDAISQDKNICLELSDIPDLALNDVEIRQAILNLTRNGLEAMERGGSVYLKTYLEGNEVVLLVQDEGRGIDQKILNNLGTPFLTTKEQGTGLGLAVTLAIIERHQAKVQVDSNSKGTKFFIRWSTASK